ncbi:acyltransferase family protein [Streptomyces stelliscabiei]|uniref:Peptidoglycan/LPS O-acetylase OafA/YrhL n=1 Tax=Streptomyces stelliscabiei TaxID=146820 RepID=A0A8I0TUY8_9ACTN|nr:acyltransferase [Streptomyces stelliscabiei]KND41944.1 acyltransferase [Streptomyces stelliscabiei]MBE1598808.1 peptidoglycan/LPS O-acetylase OafA/YrhL [Streptomyces stelliscabiei]MDX2516405.1 acyltransferase [Streptomyces stelliscabiei]MDX2553711.1 acyltransferase [Streptomyces stelliscabiei]MDX2613313.1 acyltransferase [Streptomyces stelliscabiei]
MVSSNRAKLPSLTGLRFFAALLVFFFHSSLSNSPIPPNDPINPFADADIAHAYEKTFLNTGYIGVSFFFVLSGFVLAWSARPGQSARAFWRRRMTKIFPNHLVVFAASLILFAGATINSIGQWLPNMLLVHTFFPQPEINLSVNPPSWSLGSELLFYLLFPLLIVPIQKIRDGALWAWSAVMVAGTVVFQLVSMNLVPDTPKSAITPISDMQFWFGYLFPPGRLFEFTLGILLARIVLAGRWPQRIGIGVSLGLCAIGYAAGFVLPFEYTFVAATIIPIGALIASVAAADVAGRRTWLRSRPMVWLGEVSFGFYLVQGVSIFYLRSLLDGATYGVLGAMLLILGFFGTSLLGGWLLYRFVEMPAMRRLSRSRKEVRSPLPDVPAPVAADAEPAEPTSLRAL